MNKIGFKNFRRFQNFETLEFNGVTFLVGRNNAGKSTLVKALLLIENYFKSGNTFILSFGNSVLEDANIVTYGRARNYNATEDMIFFTQHIEDYLIEMTVSGEDNKSFANLNCLVIKDLRYKLDFIFNLSNNILTVTKGKNEENIALTKKLVSEVEIQIIETNKQIAETELKKTSREYIELVSLLDRLEGKLGDVKKNASDPMDEMLFSLDQEFGDSNSLMEIVNNFLVVSVSQYEREFVNNLNGELVSEKFESLRALKEFDPIFVESSFAHFTTLMSNFTIAYLGASPAKQSALFAIRDKGNALAQAIHEYQQLNIGVGEEEHRFVLKWMREFEVGDDFSISMYAGEAYEMKILSNGFSIHLADKGMGSIQAMLLIMRIACVIKKIAEDGKGGSDIRLIDKTTVIIEEPELNLHPALQSKLADLFLDVHLRFGIDFLIETHSEYVLRRSQVLVAENEFEVAPNENPFFVYYFPKEIGQMPYKLEYNQDGSFKKNFGDGFFDEAASSTLELLKLKRQKKA